MREATTFDYAGKEVTTVHFFRTMRAAGIEAVVQDLLHFLMKVLSARHALSVVDEHRPAWRADELQSHRSGSD